MPVFPRMISYRAAHLCNHLMILVFDSSTNNLHAIELLKLISTSLYDSRLRGKDDRFTECAHTIARRGGCAMYLSTMCPTLQSSLLNMGGNKGGDEIWLPDRSTRGSNPTTIIMGNKNYRFKTGLLFSYLVIS